MFDVLLDRTDIWPRTRRGDAIGTAATVDLDRGRLELLRGRLTILAAAEAGQFQRIVAGRCKLGNVVGPRLARTGTERGMGTLPISAAFSVIAVAEHRMASEKAVHGHIATTRNGSPRLARPGDPCLEDVHKHEGIDCQLHQRLDQCPQAAAETAEKAILEVACQKVPEQPPGMRQAAPPAIHAPVKVACLVALRLWQP